MLLATAVVAVACSATPSATPSHATVAIGHSHPATTTTTTVPPTTTTTEQPGWTPASAIGAAIAIDNRAVPLPDGSTVTLFRFRAPMVRFGLHVGSTDPPATAAEVGPDSGPAIGPQEAPVLLAAFNGGFKTNAGAGGFELNSQVLVPLQSGAASLVLDTDGSAHVGVWGQGLPLPGEQVSSVRQNLQPLVAGGQPSPAIGATSAWGATLGGGASVARSALGQDAVRRPDLCREHACRPERPGSGADQCRSALRHGAGHQPGVDTAGVRQLTRRAADGRRTGTGPSGQPVPGRMDVRLRDGVGLLALLNPVLGPVSVP